MKIDTIEILSYIEENNCDKNTKIYLGVDSTCFRKEGKLYAEFTIALIIHKNGCNGGKVFGEIIVDRIYENRKDKPQTRLIMEVYKLCEVYLRIVDQLSDFDIELHLDISRNEKHKSFAVLQQAVGIVKGMCNKNPKTKPESWCASSVAHSLRRLTEEVV